MLQSYIQKKLLLHLAILVCLIIGKPGVTIAQSANVLSNTIQRKLSLYQQKHPASLLFVHFDKTLYSGNENVWFTAYLLNCNTPQLHHTLSISLINDTDHAVVMEERFLMREGIGFGNLFLPDSVPQGNYTFMVYTNRMVNQKPEVFFTQPVTIKTTAQPDFKAILSLKDTSSIITGISRDVLVNVNGTDYLPIANATINYSLIGNDTLITRGKAKTDKAGQYTIKVPVDKRAVKVQIKNKLSSQYLHIIIPQVNKHLKVRFYPEGGSLVNNLLSQVGWEIKNSEGQPIRATGVIYCNNKPGDTIETDSYGMGRFLLRPVANAIYKIKLLNYPALSDTAYQLPKSLPQGLVMNMFKAVVNDTLNLQLSSSYNGIVYLHIHDYQQHFSTVPVQVNVAYPRKVKVALGQIPKGLAEVTLTDSFGRPYAERIFFAHHDLRELFSVKSNKETYNTREKVRLNLRLFTQNGLSKVGYVSVACVQDNRLELKKSNNIESYLYLKSALGSLPLKENYLGLNTDDKEYLECVMLVKGWRKYSWTDLLKTKLTDTATNQTSLTFTGRVSKLGKALKKPMNFMLLRDSSSMILTTNTEGDLSFRNEDLINSQDKPLRFMINANDGYRLRINNPYSKLNQQLGYALKSQNFELQPTSQSSENVVIKGLEKAIQLKAVKVTSTKDNSLYGGRLYFNSCNDYVCRYNVFNCPNHRFEFDNRPPTIGASYNGRVYLGCGGKPEDDSNVKTFAGIYESKQFYGSDYAVVNPSQPEYISTIFWQHLVAITSVKDSELSFYTSDITGKFRIVVQGITPNGVVYNESFINVKKP
ncbi:hypothetical protein MUGA111182_07450 [Mucilaginibacter galii]|uniref:Macroglobulin domain-containing protein n=1 Tax=Mucilaginibacter galii TaxID=2005073 RepID=A0A917JCW6_9SPHI|nr:hypothetical protein [Mucilaginibacter galii]GGI51404.1 hypothetical protein GCM10011425_26160 [Mucilaginibacter galii]